MFVPDTTPVEVVTPADAPPAGAAQPEPQEVPPQTATPEPISAEEATRRENAVAASARTQAEQAAAEVIAGKDAELETFRAADTERERADMAANERLEAEKADALAEVAKYKTAADTAMNEKAAAERQSEIANMIGASATKVPAAYQAEVYTAMTSAEAVLDQDAVNAELVKARAKFDGDVGALAPAPTTSVGSPATQPATGTPQLTPEQNEARLAALVERSQQGDQDAIAELMKR